MEKIRFESIDEAYILLTRSYEGVKNEPNPENKRLMVTRFNQIWNSIMAQYGFGDDRIWNFYQEYIRKPEEQKYQISDDCQDKIDELKKQVKECSEVESLSERISELENIKSDAESIFFDYQGRGYNNDANAINNQITLIQIKIDNLKTQKGSK